ncbi:hypothetical protein F4677DRAFT_456785 [Hypoxylon crocopeplum]|nr:hypothetical protein F4677DRAFT_456785 [Hypoxylon crocopeplum]
MDHTTSPLRRPNGRLQACDPCRKRKLACDHTRPVCTRCRKRKQDAECVYIVAGPKTPSSTGPLPSPRSSTRPPDTRRGTPQSSYNGPTVRPDVQVPNFTGSGYLGPTSYCTVFDELPQGSEGVTSQGENVAHHTPIESSQDIMSPRVREMCLTVLRNVPEPAIGRALLFKHGNDGWIRPAALQVVKSMYDMFGRYFGRDRNERQLEELARTLCINTTRPFSDGESDPERWISQFSGENLRWEFVGILSVFWDFVPGSETAVWKGKRSAEFDRSFRTARENLRLCLELCKEFSNGNSLMLYLSQRCTVVHSMFVGDANLLVWRSHAESISLLTFLGFHVAEERDRQQSSVCSEIKKRLFHHMYTMAMVVVSFTGRPPLLGSRFASTPLPLDISDETLFSDHDTFLKAVDRLDEKGWNTDGMIYASTRIRARAILAAIREELFEIALGKDHVASIDTLLQFRARELQAVSEFPACIQFDPLDLEDQQVALVVFASRLFVQLEHLQNMFFIERLLLRYGHEDKGDLLKVSYDLVTLTLPWLAAFRNDAEWLVMAYAVPAGGILCLELLKPTLHISPHSDPRITRSNIIQKLSLLIAYLDWVSPSGPNGDLCNDARSVIQRVLDQTLNAASSVYEPPAVFEWDFSTQLDFNFDLLDTFDWNRPDFPLSQQSN